MGGGGSRSLYMTLLFSLAVLKILSLAFAIWIEVCLGVNLFGFILLGTLFFLDLAIYCFLQVLEVSALIVSNIFSTHFSFWNPIMLLVHLLFQRALKLSSLFILLYNLLIPSSVFHFSYCITYLIGSLYFLVLVKILIVFLCSFPKSVSIFITIALSYFHLVNYLSPFH